MKIYNIFTTVWNKFVLDHDTSVLFQCYLIHNIKALEFLLSPLWSEYGAEKLWNILKNIPIPSHKNYLLQFIDAVEKLIHRVRRKTFAYLNPDKMGHQIETHGFNTMKPSPIIPELKPWEDGLKKIVQSVEFRPYSDDFRRAWVNKN